MDIHTLTTEIARQAKAAARVMGRLSTAAKNDWLLHSADLITNERESICEANQRDLKEGKERGLSSAMLDRLALTDKRIVDMTVALREIAALPDPVGEISGVIPRPSGIFVGKMRVPIGVFGMIY
ncbi:MAG TPA: gamma-glutamyl-phosphate reductase, partial [bacterium]|nr:gamma-glutamyl-phosphate reductase [bacterium]